VAVYITLKNHFISQKGSHKRRYTNKINKAEIYNKHNNKLLQVSQIMQNKCLGIAVAELLQTYFCPWDGWAKRN